MKLIGYIKARLDERSTWQMIGATVAAVYMFAGPDWSGAVPPGVCIHFN